jgi:hypothetical protein
MRFTHASIPDTTLAIGLTSFFDSTVSISAKFECDSQTALQVAIDQQVANVDQVLTARVLLPLRQRVSELVIAFADADRVRSALQLMAPPSTERLSGAALFFEMQYS